MRLFIPVVLMTASLSATGQTPVGTASVTQYLVALPHMAFGGPWRTVFLVRNTDNTSAQVTVTYFGDDGNSLQVSINGAPSPETTVTIPPHGQAEIIPDQGPTTIAGWAALSYTNGGISAQAVFQWTPPGASTEAVAPIISRMSSGCIIALPPTAAGFSMPFDNIAGKFSGYAFANTTAAAVTLQLTFFDETGQQVGNYSQPFAAFGHTQFLLRDKLPQLNNRKGTMLISGQGIVPLGFRFTQAGNLTTFTTWLP